MQTATVSEQGQVIIPLDIRKQLDITPGCQLSFIVEGVYDPKKGNYSVPLANFRNSGVIVGLPL